MQTSAAFNHLVAFFNLLEGRDSASKFAQYGCRTSKFYALQADKGSSMHEAGLRMEAFYKATSQARKLFKMGRSIKEYHAAVGASAKEDVVTSTLGVLYHSWEAVFLLSDNAIFLTKAKVLKWDAKRLGRISNAIWAISQSFALALGLVELRRLRAALSALSGGAGGYEEHKEDELKAKTKQLSKKIVDKQLGLLKTLCNFIVACNSAEWIAKLRGSKLNDGIIGVVGCIAACISMRSAWAKTAPKRK